MNKSECKSYLKNEREYREQKYNQKFIDKLSVKNLCSININSLEKNLRKDAALFISSFSINIFPDKCYCNNLDTFLKELTELKYFAISIKDNPTKQIIGLDSEKKILKALAEKLVKNKAVNIQLEFYMKRKLYKNIETIEL